MWSKNPAGGCWTPAPRITCEGAGLHSPASTTRLWALSSLLTGLWSALRALGQCSSSARMASIVPPHVCTTFLDLQQASLVLDSWLMRGMKC
jgi:hypothetical protein